MFLELCDIEKNNKKLYFDIESQQPSVEQWQLVDTVDQDRDEIDDLDDPPSPVCYYIVSGNDDNYFTLEPLSHKITVNFKNILQCLNSTNFLIILKYYRC